MSESISVRGARVHNLQNIDVDIPRDRLVVITGVSGSGKSSLAFDTIFAEGQRRYLESLSTYTRQFLNQMERPDIDSIEGLPPTMSVDQRVGSVALRSTLATATEIYDYLRLLYARAGTAHCPDCGLTVESQSTQTIVDQILALEERRKVMILAPIVRGRKGAHRDVFEKIAREGLVRARVNGEVVDAADAPDLAANTTHNIEAVIDRIVVKDGIRGRLQESVDLAVRHGDGMCLITHQDGEQWIDHLYSTTFACANCSTSFPNLEPRSFSFNSPYGACDVCSGLGVIAEQNAKEDEDLGDIFAQPKCSACEGTRLTAFPRHVTFGDMTLPQLTALPVVDGLEFTSRLLSLVDELPPADAAVAKQTLPEVQRRLEFLVRVGLDYVSLDRPSRTLSGGEFQRARLASCLGAGLLGACYVLDEPTIGLHPRDTDRLMQTLLSLRDQGNTVILVEHDMDIVKQADHVVDLGPGAGREGGRVVATGHATELASSPDSITGRFLENAQPELPQRRHPVATNTLLISEVHNHNVRGVTVEIPLGLLVSVTGVSGSGKSSLVNFAVPMIRRAIEGAESPQLKGADGLERIIEVDQSPIGRSSRSNPATYSKMWDEIRRVFAKTRDARIRGYTARRFTFNAKEGRCEDCSGNGEQRIEMQFLPDIFVTCSTCRGKRYNRQTLAIRYRGKTIADVLAMRIDEAADFFENYPKLQTMLATFSNVGLGYLCLGQAARTLSGGEAQRVKLATELGRPASARTLFVLDEPTTGLHPADVQRLLEVLNGLVDRGDSVLVIEHNLDVIRRSDWIIDMGPEGGSAGGRVIATGTPEQIVKCEESHTGRALELSF